MALTLVNHSLYYCMSKRLYVVAVTVSLLD